MDPDVTTARRLWRAAQEEVDELVDLFVQRRPVDPDELMRREATEFRARRAYYTLLQERYGLPTPLGLRPPSPGT